ncbi:MAG: dihydrofolate reductase [Oscillospiraceae bacterium]
MNIVVAADRNWGIGYKGSQPIVIPEDRKHFRQVTGTGTVIVGRRTLEDFPGGRPLKNRRNIILTRDVSFSVSGGESADSVGKAFKLIAGEEPDSVFVIGGDSIYRQFLPYCTRAFVTRIEAEPPADTYFPDLDALSNWRVEDAGEEREHEGIKYRFMTYVNTDVQAV